MTKDTPGAPASESGTVHKRLSIAELKRIDEKSKTDSAPPMEKEMFYN